MGFRKSPAPKYRRRRGNLIGGKRSIVGREMKSEENQLADKKLEPGRFAEGPRSPGLSCPPPQGASKKLVTAESLEVIESKQWGDYICVLYFSSLRRKITRCAASPKILQQTICT
jgi:hypothetical protein